MSRYIIGILILISAHVNAQYRTARLPVGDSLDAKESQASYSPEDGAKGILENIIAAIGLKPKFEIKPANIPNAAAVVYGGRRYILYNPAFVSSLNKIAGNQWASVSILAHEIGHHLNGHTLAAGGSTPEMELEADEFSGFVLKKMGASLPEAQVAMKIAASQKVSHTHPAQADRLIAIANGWNNAEKQVSGRNAEIAATYRKPEPEQVTPEKQQQNIQVRQTVPDERYIVKDVHFNSDPSSDYFVTTRSNVVRVAGNEIRVIGKLLALNSEEFPLAIVGTNKNYLFINKYGKIFTPSGDKVGYVSDHN